MFEQITFIEVEGKKKKQDIILFSLTTCGFCKRAKAYLDSNEYKYRLFYADELPLEEKTALKKEFKDKFGETMHFPALILNEREFLVGFIKPHWEMLLEGES